MKTQHLSVLLLMVVLLFGCHAESNKNTSVEKDSVGIEPLVLYKTLDNRVFNPKVKKYLDKFIDKYGKYNHVFEITISDIDDGSKAIVFRSGYHSCVFLPSHYMHYRGKLILIYSSIDIIFRKEQSLNKKSTNKVGAEWCIVYSWTLDEDNNWVDNIIYFDSKSRRIPYEKFSHEIKFGPE